MRVQRIYNQDLLNSVLTKDKLWEATIEDDSITKEEAYLDLEEVVALALLGTEGGLHGFLLAKPLNFTITEVHIAIDPDYWGHKENVPLGIMACDYLFKVGPRMHKLVASIPTTDKHVLRYAQRCGFQREGVCKKSFLRNGELLDQYYVGKTRD